MKKLFVFIAVLCSFTAGAQFKSANLTAAGLTCAMCTRSINVALEKLPFVQSVTPNIKTSAFEISFKAGKAVDFDALKNAVEGAGFSVSKLVVNADFKNTEVKNDAHVQVGDKTFHFLKVPAGKLNGEKAITIVDKNFLTSKEQKKYAAATTMACVQTGKAASCCTSAGGEAGERIYHVTI
ncbi:MAG: heavy-metal-associated domain-containing protein [Chitinophagaceae bacterium]|nr:MAG: heavy-metal-associated domain-containing protein [Chitinophagaceae bacterium]